MNVGSVTRIETLNRENYDTWKMQMEALLVKNDAWGYVSGETPRPSVPEGDQASIDNLNRWVKSDNKAKSDIILSISSSELKQVKGCTTSREVWLKLEGIYQSRGPARKATLLKQLTLQRMAEGEDVRDHIGRFFDAVDKLTEMEVDINPDLLTIMLLYSLPSSFENFRCAIESRDELPTPDILRVKIIEENEARKSEARASTQDAMFTKRRFNNTRVDKKSETVPAKGFKFRCHRCKQIGHKAAECKSERTGDVKSARETSLGAANAVLVQTSDDKLKWCLDSGATSHLCKDMDDFTEIRKSGSDKINLANNATTEIVAKGVATFKADIHGDTSDISLKDALYVPDLRTNLLSVGKITDKGYKVVFSKNSAEVIDKNGETRLFADRVGDLYFAREHFANLSLSSTGSAVPSRGSSETFKLWHRRLGHLNSKDLQEAKRKNTMIGLKFNQAEKDLDCDICLKGKMTRSPFPKKSERKTSLLELIHSDVCGPMRVESNGRSKYMVTFTDDSTRWCIVRFIKSKHEVLSAFKEVVALMEVQHGRRVKCIQSDNGTEYTSTEFNNYLKSKGMSRRLSVPYCPEQNGLAERKNRTLLDMARCLLTQAQLPQAFWAEAVNTANYIRNRCPSRSLNGSTPFEAWAGKKPNVGHFREFGCRVYTFNRDPNKGKFDQRAHEGVMVGYADESKGYRVWLTREQRIAIVRDVKFIENPREAAVQPTDAHLEDFFDEEQPPIHATEIGMNPTVEEDTIPNLGQDGVVEAQDENNLRRGPGRPRLIRSGARGRPQKQYNMLEQTAGSAAGTECVFSSEVPMKQALNSPEADEWSEAMAREVRSIIRNRTWQLVDRPNDQQVIGSRIVLRNKYGPDGELERRKARLVAQGFSQRPGVHFNETFAPVARLSSIRLLTALAARYSMKIRHIDVTTAYLNGELDETVYMEPPKQLMDILVAITGNKEENPEIAEQCRRMLNDLKKGDKVCRLKKSLYGLRQAGRSWHKKIDEIMRSCGASPLNADPCLYRIGSGTDAVLIAVYVDDILLASGNSNMIEKLRSRLSRDLEIKDLGDVNLCLGIKFKRDKQGITLSQRSHVVDVLKRFGMSECKPVSTPMDQNVKLAKPHDIPDEDDKKLPYRELIGSLMYLAVATRPDISFAVSKLSQFNDCHNQEHWNAAKRVLRYLKGTMDYGVRYESVENAVEGYVDADWGSCPDDRRSYTGYVFTLGGGPISWDSKKQRTVALSSTEAEYMALSEATKEAIHLRGFLTELGFGNIADISLYSDNMGAIKLAENPTFHARSKHIDIRHHFVREALLNDEVRIDHVPTESMVADVMTKGLPRTKHSICLNRMRVCCPEDMSRLGLEGKCCVEIQRVRHLADSSTVTDRPTN